MQCEFALKASDDLDAAVAIGDITLTFCAIQAILSSAANISKALWGMRKTEKALAVRVPLRNSLQIRDDSPLRPLTMRNNYDHFDERLDQWWKESKRHNSVDLLIGARARIAGVDDIDRFRMYDPQTKDLMFWGETFNIGEIIEAIRQLHPVVTQEARKPHWVP